MLETIIQFIEGRIEALEIFTELYGLCEIGKDEVKRDGNTTERTFPVQYIGAGNYKLYPNDFDLTASHGYFKLLDVSEERDDENDLYGGETILTRTYSMRFVAYVNKDIYQVDNKYAPDKIMHNVSQMLSLEDVAGLNTSLDTISITSRVTSVEMDRYAVLDAEYDNVDLGALDLQYTYFYADFDITLSATASCLFTYACGDQVTDVATLLANAYGDCQNVTVSNSDDSYEQSVVSGGTLELPDITLTEVDGSTTTAPSVQDVSCDADLCPQFLKGVFAAGDTDMEQITIDSDSAGTYDTETTDSGTITYSVNGGAFETLAAKGGSITLADTDTLDVKRTSSASAGFFKLAN